MKKFRLRVPGLALLVFLAGGWDSAAQPAGPQTYTVVIEGMKFSPGVLTVRPGDSVVFQNNDLLPHTVTERSIRMFDSGMISRHENWKLVTGGEGTLNYQCIYHPDMKGTIIVAATEGPAPVRAGAAVELCGAP